VPDPEGRRRILEIHTENMPLADDVALDALVDRTQGYTGADLEDLVRRAGLNALREEMEADIVPMRFFETALKETRASVTPETEREYEQLARTLKQESPRGRRIGFLTATDEGGGAVGPPKEVEL
jgi:transitional endoplasmic reticulum ATPase